MGCGASKNAEVEDQNAPATEDVPAVAPAKSVAAGGEIAGPRVVVNLALPRNAAFAEVKAAANFRRHRLHHVIRIYVSSTFFDTAGERHAFKTEVIPELNKLLLARGLSVVIVDVDWSNSRFSDQDRVRQVIQLIDNCRAGRENLPWMLALRTSKYGKLLTELPPSNETISVCPEALAWLRSLEEETLPRPLSLELIELLHGALAVPADVQVKRPHTFVFTRDPSFLTHVPEDLRWVYDFEFVSPFEEKTGKDAYQYTKFKGHDLIISQKELTESDLRIASSCRSKDYKCSAGSPPEIISEKLAYDDKGYPVGKTCVALGSVGDLDAFKASVFSVLLRSICSEYAHAVRAPTRADGALKEAARQEIVMSSASLLDEAERNTYQLSSSPLGQVMKYCDPLDNPKPPLLVCGPRGSGVSSVIGSTILELNIERRKALTAEQQRLRAPMPMSARSDVSTASAMSEGSDPGYLNGQGAHLDLGRDSRDYVGPEGQVINVLTMLPQTFDRTTCGQDVVNALRRMCITVVSMFELTTYVPSDYTDLCELWPELLAAAGERADLVILIDQFEVIARLPALKDESGTTMDALAFIPEVLPPNISMVIGYSSFHDHEGDKRMLEGLKARCETVTMDERPGGDFELLVIKSEARTMVTLSSVDRQLAKKSVSPLYILLACIYRRFKHSLIPGGSEPALPETKEELLDGILTALEKEYGKALPGLVFGLLAGEDQLNESQISEIVYSSSEKIHYVRSMEDVWSLFWMDIEALVQTRSDGVVVVPSRLVLRTLRDRYLTPCPELCSLYLHNAHCTHRGDACATWEDREGKLAKLVQQTQVHRGKTKPAFLKTPELAGLIERFARESAESNTLLKPG